MAPVLLTLTLPVNDPELAVIAPVTAKLEPSNVSASLLAFPMLNL